MEIHLHRIRTKPIIGAYDFERHKRQPILINLWIDFDEGNAPQSDKLEDTFDYCELTKEIVRMVNATEFTLVEKLLSFLLDYIIELVPVRSVVCELLKPEALADYADYVSLKDSRSK